MQIRVHIDNVIKMITLTILLTSSKNVFLLDFFWVVSYFVELFDVFGDDDNIHCYF